MIGIVCLLEGEGGVQKIGDDLQTLRCLGRTIEMCMGNLDDPDLDAAKEMVADEKVQVHLGLAALLKTPISRVASLFDTKARDIMLRKALLANLRLWAGRPTFRER